MISRIWRSAPLLLALATLLWAGNSIAGRALAGVTPPFALAFWRWTVALLLVAPLAWRGLKQDAPELLRRWPMVVLLGTSGVGAFGAFLYVGLQTTTALNSLLMQAAIPPLILLFGWIGLRQRTGLPQLLGVALSLAGVLVVITLGRPLDLLHLRLNPGDAIILVGVVLYAVYSLALRFRPAVQPLSLLAATMAVAMLALAPFYAHETLAGRPLHLTWQAAAGIAYVAAGASFLGYLAFNRGVELIGPARAGQYMHLLPVFGSVLAVLLLGEAFHTYHAVGVVLIAAGIGVASIKPRRPAGEGAAEPV